MHDNKKTVFLFILMMLFISGCTGAIKESTIQESAIKKRTTKVVVNSNPQGADIYEWISQDKSVETSFKTPYSTSISGLQTQPRCYQVKKDGYYDSEIICSSAKNGVLHVHFDLMALLPEQVKYDKYLQAGKKDYVEGKFDSAYINFIDAIYTLPTPYECSKCCKIEARIPNAWEMIKIVEKYIEKPHRRLVPAEWESVLDYYSVCARNILFEGMTESNDFFKKKLYDEALRLYEFIFEKAKRNHLIISACCGLGRIHTYKNNFKQAIDYYDIALKLIDKNDSIKDTLKEMGVREDFIYHDIGDMYAKQEKIDDAIYYYKKAIASCDDCGMAGGYYWSIMNLFEKSKEFGKGVFAIKEIMEETGVIDELSYLALFSLYESWYEVNWSNFILRQYINDVKVAIKKLPDEIVFYEYLADHYLKQGQPYNAIDYLYKACNLYLKQEKRDEALKAYGKLKKIRGSKELAVRIFKKLYPQN